MILTGKCKEGFEKWFFQSEYSNIIELQDLNSSLLNALIIEYFDAIGLYILPNKSLGFDIWNYEILGHITEGFNFNSRQEATEKAIEKANDLINEELTINL